MALFFPLLLPFMNLCKLLFGKLSLPRCNAYPSVLSQEKRIYDLVKLEKIDGTFHELVILISCMAELSIKVSVSTILLYALEHNVQSIPNL